MTHETTDVGAARPIIDLLWPDESSPYVRYRALPDARNPRMLIPLEPVAAGLTALRALRDGSTPRARGRTRALVAGWRTPLAPGGVVQLPSGGVTTHLCEHFGQQVVVGIHLGPPRANRKPVLAVCAPSGDLLGFAKLGVNELTDHLVSSEADALEMLGRVGPLHSVTTPQLRWRDSWAHHPLVVQSSVSRAGRAVADVSAVAAAQVEVSTLSGRDNDAATYLKQLSTRLARRSAGRAHEDAETYCRLHALLGRIEAQFDLTDIGCGAWHGDWRITNMAVRRQGVAVWDWERFATGVPLGFDALHLALTTLSPRTGHVSELVPALFSRAEQVLSPFELGSPTNMEAVTTLYLVELATRYVEDEQAHSGSRLGDVTTWLLPGLEARLAATR